MPKVHNQATALVITLNVETVVTVLPPIAVTGGNFVDLAGLVDITAGAGVTGMTVSLRRGSTVAGALVQALGPFAVTAATRVQQSFSWADVQVADVNNQQYVLTVTQTGATGNGNVNAGYARADW